ncbi:anti-sigma factor family protein [Thermodesulfobacteriota bacterium]
MKTHNTACDPTLLNLLYDGELSPEEDATVRDHLKNCPACRKELERNESVSHIFKDELNRELSLINQAALERKIVDRIQKKRAPFLAGFRNIFSPLRLLVPAAAVAGMVFFFFFTIKSPAPNSSPSAIINSFTGDVSSVMILETPETHQTIIWINEI